MVKNPPTNAGDMGLIPDSGRSPEDTLGTHGKGLGGEDRRLAGELRLRAAAPGRQERLHCAIDSSFSPGFFSNNVFHGTLVPWQGFWEAAGSKPLLESPRGCQGV